MYENDNDTTIRPEDVDDDDDSQEYSSSNEELYDDFSREDGEDGEGLLLEPTNSNDEDNEKQWTSVNPRW